MYLQLYHGRHAPDEELSDWGFDGPIFHIPDELSGVTMTYACEIQFEYQQDHFGLLKIDGDCLYYDGAWYGDWSFMSDAFFKKHYAIANLQEFDAEKAKIPDGDEQSPSERCPRPVPLQQVQTRTLTLGKKRQRDGRSSLLPGDGHDRPVHTAVRGPG